MKMENETQEISKLRADLNFIQSKNSIEEIDIYRHKLIANYVKKGKTLDVGFGHIPNQFLKNPIGLDIGKAPKPKNYSKVVVGDACDMPFEDGEFDNVIVGELIEHLENPSQFYREAHRVLKSEGRLVISTPNPCNPIAVIKNELFNRYPLLTDHVNETPPIWLNFSSRITALDLLRKEEFTLESPSLPDMFLTFGVSNVNLPFSHL